MEGVPLGPMEIKPGKSEGNGGRKRREKGKPSCSSSPRSAEVLRAGNSTIQSLYPAIKEAKWFAFENHYCFKFRD